MALTRAKALLVIVGNPNILGLDPVWRNFLTYVYLGGGWKGLEPEWDPQPDSITAVMNDREAGAGVTEMDMLTQHLRELAVDRIQAQIEEGGDDDYDATLRETNQDRPWRREDE